MLDQEKIGKFIMEKRKAAGFTQQQLAGYLGVTNKAVSKWETGEGLPDISLFPVLGEVLGVSVDELLAGESISAASPQKIAAAVTDGPRLRQYQIEKRLEKFKIQALGTLLISILGIVAFLFIWLERQDYYSWGIGIASQIISIFLFVYYYRSWQFELKSYQMAYTEDKAGEKIETKTFLIPFLSLAVVFWALLPVFFFTGKAIHLLVPFSFPGFLDIALGVGIYAVVVWAATYLIRHKNSRE